MNNKTITEFGFFLSYEELWRSRRVLSASAVSIILLDLPTSRAQIFSRARSASGRFFMFSSAKANQNEKRRTLRKSIILHTILRALSIQEKNPNISVGAKVEFPIGKKLLHLVLNPGTSRCPIVHLELVQTTRNVSGTRHSVRKLQPGKRAHLFRFSTFSGNFPVGRADETCSIYRRTRNSGIFG